MDRQITHPTKEQVRAYMARRESAPCPPPAPDEIRRELGWRLAPVHDEPMHDEPVLLQFCLLPSTYGQLTAQLVLDWLLAPSRAISATGIR